MNVLNAARQAGVRRVVNASTGGAIYGEGQTIPAPEDHPVAPEAPYGLSKFCAEHYCGSFTACTACPPCRCGSATSTARARTRSARPA